jgi:hypothetical protein
MDKVQKPSRLLHAIKLKAKNNGKVSCTVVWYWGGGGGVIKTTMKGSILRIFYEEFREVSQYLYTTVLFSKKISYERSVGWLKDYD